MTTCFKKRSLFCRRVCIYYVALLALISISLFYVLKEYKAHRQSRLDFVPDSTLHSADTDHVHVHSIKSMHKNAQLAVTKANSDRTVGHHESIHRVSRFLLGLNYWEQLTMATVNMFQLVCLADSWNASVVQPFTLDSRLYGLRNFKADEKVNKPQSAHDLDLIYDMEKLNSLLMRHKLPQLIKFDEFLRHSSRQLIVIHYIPLSEAHELKVMTKSNGSRIRSAFKQDSVVDCAAYLEGYRERLTRTLNEELQAASLQGPHFTIVKYVCVNMSVLTTPPKLGAKVGIPSEGDASVIVVNWRGASKNAVILNSARGVHLNKKVSMAEVCRKSNVSGLISGALPHSKLVSQTVREFMRSIGLKPGQEFIAIHLRSEKIGLRETRFPHALNACISKLTAVRRQLTNMHPNLTVIDMTDFGPYSSDTCRMCWSAVSARNRYKKLGIEPVHFNPAHFNVPVDRGFASVVDVELLALSSYLVLCGGGAFQHQTALRFINSGKNEDRLIQVCTTDGSVSAVLKTQSLVSA